MVGRIDVEDFDIRRWLAVDKVVLGSTQLY